jgi:hypothetical protein
MTTTRVAWRRSDEIEADEFCTLSVRGGGLSLVGTILGAEGGQPIRIEYRVFADAKGFTTAVHVRQLVGFEQRAIALLRDAKGNWSVDGKRVAGLRSCSDVDLGCSPSTNTLPIRRLRLGIAASRTISAAWIRFPSLEVVKAAQTYRRLDESTYHYASGTFEADMSVDDEGLVTSYAEWRRTAYALGPDDSAPLDALP